MALNRKRLSRIFMIRLVDAKGASCKQMPYVRMPYIQSSGGDAVWRNRGVTIMRAKSRETPPWECCHENIIMGAGRCKPRRVCTQYTTDRRGHAKPFAMSERNVHEVTTSEPERTDAVPVRDLAVSGAGARTLRSAKSQVVASRILEQR